MTPLPETLRGRLDETLNRLTATAQAARRKAPRRGHGDSYMACCPAHDDHNPSLSVTLEGERILLNCFAGCSFEDICDSIGMPQEAMFADYRGEAGRQPRICWNGSSRVAAEGLYEYLGEDVPRGTFVPLPPSLAEFRAMEWPPVEPILGPIATQQTNLIFAPTGAGKTMLGLAMAYAIAEGREFLGWESSGPRRVLYVDGEMAAGMIAERFGGASSERLYIANIYGWWTGVSEGAELNLATDEGQDLLNIWINGLGIDVVFLDNFMSLAWLPGVSFSSDEIWSPLKRWMFLQRSNGKTVILVDHANSQGAVFGTKTKTIHMDLIGHLEPREEGPEWEDPQALTATDSRGWATLKWTKKRGFSESDSRLDSRTLKIGGIESLWKWMLADQEFEMEISELRQNGLSIREIAKELGVSYSKVQRTWRRVQLRDSVQ